MVCCAAAELFRRREWGSMGAGRDLADHFSRIARRLGMFSASEVWIEAQIVDDRVEVVNAVGRLRLVPVRVASRVERRLDSVVRRFRAAVSAACIASPPSLKAPVMSSGAEGKEFVDIKAFCSRIREFRRESNVLR